MTQFHLFLCQFLVALRMSYRIRIIVTYIIIAINVMSLLKSQGYYYVYGRNTSPIIGSVYTCFGCNYDI